LKRSAHLLLAILAGILLHVGLLAVGVDAEWAAAAKSGSGPGDSAAAGVLVDTDLPDASKPYVGGSTPKSLRRADANVTTLIAGIVLLGFGSGPIKNFAVTLSLGIATSMFTAVWGTRTLVDLWYGKRRIERLSVG
jgi:hypothetical protein